MPVGQYSNWSPANNWGSAPSQWTVPYQQPQTINNFQQQQSQQPVNNLLRVTGPESAKAYPLPANSHMVLFDADNPIFYVKSTDDSGFASLRTFIFEEQQQLVNEAPPQVEPMDISNFATKDDLTELQSNVSEIKQILEGLVN